jgi:hypothetical protein
LRKEQNEIAPRGKLVKNGPRGSLRDGMYQKEKFERFGKRPAGLKNSSSELDLGFFNPEKHAKPEPMFIRVKNFSQIGEKPSYVRKPVVNFQTDRSNSRTQTITFNGLNDT